MNFLTTWILPFGLMFLMGHFLSRMMAKRMGGNAMTFGKSNAKIYAENETGKTFADVAGEEEAKEALKEIVDFLHDPKKYADIGATLPREPFWWALREPVRHFWQRLWQERPMCRFSPSPARSSWRCSWAWERPRSATCLSRPTKRPLYRIHRRDRYHR